MVKKTNPANENPFALLSEGESENDVASGSVVDARPGNFRRNSETSRKSGNSAPSGTKSFVKTPIGSAGRNPKQAAGGNFNYSQEFPALPGTQKMPGVSLSQSELNPAVSEQTQFSTASRNQSGDATRTQFSASGSQPSIAPGLPFASASGTRFGSGLIPFSELVDAILTAFNASESIRALAKMFVPSLKPFVQQLAENWPILNLIVSFDG